MSVYRTEWPCCNSVTETKGWVPDKCPFCDLTDSKELVLQERERCALKAEIAASTAYTVGNVEEFRSLAAAIRSGA